jgi:hypothetical protein
VFSFCGTGSPEFLVTQPAISEVLHPAAHQRRRSALRWTISDNLIVNADHAMYEVKRLRQGSLGH